MNTAYSTRRTRANRYLLAWVIIASAILGGLVPTHAAAASASPATSASASFARLQLSPYTYAAIAPAAQPTPVNSALISRLQSLATVNPVPAPYSPSEGQFRYFPQTAHFLRGAFLRFWQSHGATPILGLPVTEPLVEDGLVVQYLERVRLEWHPEVSDARNQVLLTRLGAILAEARGLQFTPVAGGTNTPSSAFFPETGHNLSNAFLSYWLRNGGLAVFGYPLSEEVVEVSPTNGQPYTVQYFERNRFEWHPENPPAYNVQIGLLGVEYARMVSLNPLARILLPAALPAADADLTESPALARLVEDDLLPAVQALGRTQQFRWVPAVIVANNIPVEFAEIDEEGVAGATIRTRSRTRPLVIAIPESERGESIASLASVLAHEATHAYNITSGVASIRMNCSVEEELRAFMNGLAAWVVLQGGDALAQTYEPKSLDAAVNRSVVAFNAFRAQLVFDFNPQAGRSYLRTLYGDSCGQ